MKNNFRNREIDALTACGAAAEITIMTRNVDK